MDKFVEYLKALWEKLKTSPKVLKIALPLLVCAIVILLLLCSCGVGKTAVNASIKNKADGTTTNLSISGTSGSTVSMQVDPNISLELKNVDTIPAARIRDKP